MKLLARWRVRGYLRLWRINEWLQRRWTPPGRWTLGGLSAAALFAVDMRNTLAFQLAALLGLLMAAGLLGNRRLAEPPRLQRRLPEFATVGVPLRYRLVLRAPRRDLAEGLLLRERLDAPLPGVEALHGRPSGQGRRVPGYQRWLGCLRQQRGADSPLLSLPALPRHSEVEVEARLLPLRRGPIRLTGVDLLKPDLFGLSLSPCRIGRDDTLLVLPRHYAVPALQFPGRRERRPRSPTHAPLSGGSQEFHALRLYRPGDPLRHLHFPSWARTGRPHVREFCDETCDRQALLLDTCAPPGRAACFEAAVSVAASLVLAGRRADQALELLFLGARPIHLSAGPGRTDHRRLLEALACAQLTPAQAFDELATMLCAHAGGLSAVALVLLAWDRTRRALVEALRSTGLAVRVFCLCEGPDAATGPGGTTVPGQGCPGSPEPTTEPGVQWLRSDRIESELRAALAMPSPGLAA